MKRFYTWTFALAVLGLAPAVASGGLLDWLLPVEKIATTARDITWAVLLKQFLDTWMPLIGVLLVAAVAAVCGVAARRVLGDLADSLRDAMRDGRISGAESVFLVPLYVIGGLVALALAAFMLSFGWLALEGAFDLMTTPVK